MTAHATDTDGPLTVVQTSGARLVVADETGAERAFVIHRLTGRWVEEGAPYWGVRLRLDD